MIGYLGPEGTFSHLAALEYFGTDADLSAYPSIYSLIMAANSGEVEKAIVPIENSIEGSVNITLDTLAFDAGELNIVGEHVLKICENLMALPCYTAADITKIMSHPQPIAQCSRLLHREFALIPVEYTESTAQAASIAADSGKPYGVLGPISLAKKYGLKVIYADCGDESSNSTRFVVVQRRAGKCEKADKTSIAFTLDNRPGSLFGALEIFAKNNINMIKIESRPVKKELGKYIFFIDTDGNCDDKIIQAALENIRSHTDFYRFLGSYESAK